MSERRHCQCCSPMVAFGGKKARELLEGSESASSTGYLKALPRIRNADGSLKHIIREGSREHVISYYRRSDGTSYQRCSEPECEINRQPSDNAKLTDTGGEERKESRQMSEQTSQTNDESTSTHV